MDCKRSAFWLPCLFLAVVVVVGALVAGEELSERLTDEGDKSAMAHFKIPAFVKDNHFSRTCFGRRRRIASNNPVDFRLTEGYCHLIKQDNSWTCSPFTQDNLPRPVIRITQSKESPFEAEIKYYYWKSPQTDHIGMMGEVRIYPGEGVKAMRRWWRGAIEFASNDGGSALFIKLPRSGKIGGLVNPPKPSTRDLKIPYRIVGGATLKLSVPVQYCPTYPIPRYLFVVGNGGGGPHFDVKKDNSPGPYGKRPTGLALVARPPWSKERVRMEFMGRQSWPNTPGNLLAYVTGSDDEQVVVEESQGKVKLHCSQCSNNLTGHIVVIESKLGQVVEAVAERASRWKNGSRNEAPLL